MLVAVGIKVAEGSNVAVGVWVLVCVGEGGFKVSVGLGFGKPVVVGGNGVTEGLIKGDTVDTIRLAE